MRPGSRRIFIYYWFILLKAAYFMCRDLALSGIISLCFRHYRSKLKHKGKIKYESICNAENRQFRL